MTSARLRKPAQPNQSIERAINCLLELVNALHPISCKEMGERLGIERTKVSRMLGTLAYLGMAERLPDLRYVAGAGVHVLASMSLRGSGLLRFALPHIEFIMGEWNLIGALGVLWRDQVSYLYHAESSSALSDALGGHALFPAEKSSIGQVILAQKTEAEVNHLLAPRLSPDELKVLHTSLAEIRDQGYYLEGSHSLAVPIGHPAIAGLAFQGKWPSKESPQLLSQALYAANMISQQLTTGKA
jgi:DNA-binding IclR family transcriptional regulator